MTAHFDERDRRTALVTELCSTQAGRDLLLRTDFASFVMETFNEVTPGVELLWAPYLDLICSRLEDVVHGRRRRLIITMPPRHLKSFCVSAALPAFFLGHYPGLEIMCVSYAQTLSREFAKDTQKIMMSETYQRLFGPVLRPGRQSPLTLETREGGIRRATSLDGTATGVGGHLLIFDDPQKAGETLSDAIRQRTNSAYEQTFASRGNDPENERTIIVMQRLHEDDFVSHVQRLGGEWEVINLPVIAEEDEVIPYTTFLGPSEYRRSVGEILHPKRMSLETLEMRRRGAVK